MKRKNKKNEKGFAAVREDGKWGITNKEGVLEVKPVFEAFAFRVDKKTNDYTDNLTDA